MLRRIAIVLLLTMWMPTSILCLLSMRQRMILLDGLSSDNLSVSIDEEGEIRLKLRNGTRTFVQPGTPYDKTERFDTASAQKMKPPGQYRWVDSIGGELTIYDARIENITDDGRTKRFTLSKRHIYDLELIALIGTGVLACLVVDTLNRHGQAFLEAIIVAHLRRVRVSTAAVSLALVIGVWCLQNSGAVVLYEGFPEESGLKVSRGGGMDYSDTPATGLGVHVDFDGHILYFHEDHVSRYPEGTYHFLLLAGDSLQWLSTDVSIVNPGAMREANKVTIGFTDPRTRVRIPLWIPIVLSALWVGRYVFVVIRAKKRYDAGLCPQCGYDLRASGTSCPECGSQIPQLPAKDTDQSNLSTQPAR